MLLFSSKKLKHTISKLFEIEKPKAEDEEAASEEDDSFDEDNFKD